MKRPLKPRESPNAPTRWSRASSPRPHLPWGTPGKPTSLPFDDAPNGPAHLKASPGNRKPDPATSQADPLATTIGPAARAASGHRLSFRLRDSNLRSLWPDHGLLIHTVTSVLRKAIRSQPVRMSDSRREERQRAGDQNRMISRCRTRGRAAFPQPTSRLGSPDVRWWSWSVACREPSRDRSRPRSRRRGVRGER